MVKKKKYVPKEEDGWDAEEDKEHRRMITEKQKKIAEKYKNWWDSKNHKWKDGFTH